MTFEFFHRRGLRGKRWYFRIKARNGETVASSEGYRNFKDAQGAAFLIQREAATANSNGGK